MAKVFLSYSARDIKEVEQLDSELRRRGVPLWRDREDLSVGRLADPDIEEAAEESAGFVFYLTMNAAQSEWVREREREHALNIASQRGAFGIVPIFRDDRKAVCAEMVRLGANQPGATTPHSPYDLSGHAGYVIDHTMVARGRLGDELSVAAGQVLLSLMKTISEDRGNGAPLNIGLATRGGPALGKYSLDLLVDWTEDFKKLPGVATCEKVLQPGLTALWKAIRKYWPGPNLRLYPQCHLSMALAVGFQFRRNTGAKIEIVNPYTEEKWQGPSQPLEALPSAWEFCDPVITLPGRGIGLAVNISQPMDRFRQTVEGSIDSAGLDVGTLVFACPQCGPSRQALNGKASDEVHRWAVAAADKILDLQGLGNHTGVHLFVAGPPGFAILLGQQLSNVGAVQAYEWKDSEKVYGPSFRLLSS